MYFLKHRNKIGYGKVKIRWGFRSKTQLPLFMIWREYWENDDVTYATVLFNSRDWIGI